MFRRILQLTPGRVGAQNAESEPSAAPGNTVNNESTSEGFICPLCMKMYITAPELAEHYESEHVESGTRRQQPSSDPPDATGFICPLCMKSHGTAEELFKHYEASHEPCSDAGHGGEVNSSTEREEILLLRREVQDLQASLKI